jgi:hypothetical protein
MVWAVAWEKMAVPVPTGIDLSASRILDVILVCFQKQGFDVDFVQVESFKFSDERTT